VSVRVVKVTARALGAITVHRVAPPTPPHIARLKLQTPVRQWGRGRGRAGRGEPRAID